jgi:ABC-2 type transport system ATP-binding protein
MSDDVIETASLRKVYGAKVAVADLTLRVPRGEVFGFLGPNGAGKSTSVKMLLGLVRPSSGSALLLGRAPGEPAVMARVGFLPEHFRFHEWLRAAEFLDLHGRLLGMDAEARRRRVPETLALVGLSEQAQRPLSDFSKGMLQRIGLAQALLNNPELVFLDEPTSALDPFGRMLVRGVIRELRERGTTVFLNSHLLGEVEATCDRVAFIRQGVVLQTTSLRELGAGQLQVELRAERLAPETLAWLREVSRDTIATDSADTPEGARGLSPITYRLTLEDEDALPQIAERVMAGGAKLYALTPRRLSLEQMFLEVVGKEDSGQ